MQQRDARRDGVKLTAFDGAEAQGRGPVSSVNRVLPIGRETGGSIAKNITRQFYNLCLSLKIITYVR